MAINSVLADTNAVTAFFQGKSNAFEIFETTERLYITFVVIAELYAGFRAGTRERENMQRLDDLLKATQAVILYPDFKTIEGYSAIYAVLRKKGKPIPTNDLWIAALAIQYNLPLFTLDKHFALVDQLELIALSNG